MPLFEIASDAVAFVVGCWNVVVVVVDVCIFVGPLLVDMYEHLHVYVCFIFRYIHAIVLERGPLFYWALGYALGPSFWQSPLWLSKNKALF